MIFSERLLYLRKEFGLNQKEFAAQLGVEPSKYNKWENDVNCPNYEIVCRLADYFHTSTDYLLGHTNARYPENEGIVSALGLSDAAIKQIKSFQKQGVGNKTDNRSFLDMFNLLFEGKNADYFRDMLKYAKRATHAQSVKCNEKYSQSGHIASLLAAESIRSIIKQISQRWN